MTGFREGEAFGVGSGNADVPPAQASEVWVLYGFRDGALLCLCADPHALPEWATVRYTFATPSELVFAAHYAPLVRTLSGATVEGGSFTSHDAAREFRTLRGDRG
jgi:hypothetical protein